MGTTVTQEEVRFSSGVFANTHPSPLLLTNPWSGEEELYPDSETAFHCAKATSQEDHDRVLAAGRTAAWRGSKAMGHQIKLRGDWNEVRVKIMYRINLKKFSKQPLRDILLETAERTIIEARLRDNFWGIGPDGSGPNWQGQVLMKCRSSLRQQKDVEKIAENWAAFPPAAMAQADI